MGNFKEEDDKTIRRQNFQRKKVRRDESGDSGMPTSEFKSRGVWSVDRRRGLRDDDDDDIADYGRIRGMR